VERFEGRTAVVTGAGSGIGLAMAQRFGQEGMHVVLADIVTERLEASEARLRDEGLDVHGIECDVTKLSSVESLAEATLSRFSGVHVVCNNAAIGPGGQTMLWESEVNDWRWAIDVNVYGVVWGIKTFVPIMLEHGDEGHVVNTTSTNGGIAPMGDTAIYAATKAMVVTMTELLWHQLRSSGSNISASVLFPGPNWLRTNLWEAWRTRPDEYAKERPRTTPYPTLDGLEHMMSDAGVTIEFTPLEEVAARLVDGIRADTFWILPESESTDETIRKRAASMLERRNPNYFRDWKPSPASEENL